MFQRRKHRSTVPRPTIVAVPGHGVGSAARKELDDEIVQRIPHSEVEEDMGELWAMPSLCFSLGPGADLAARKGHRQEGAGMGQGGRGESPPPFPVPTRREHYYGFLQVFRSVS